MSGSDVTECIVDLPSGVEAPFEVYLNGIPQTAGTDFRIDGRTLVFPRTIVPEAKMSKLQWVLVTFGITAGHAKHDSVDVIYSRDGRRLVATGLRPRA